MTHRISPRAPAPLIGHTAPARSVPEGVEKRLLIDGQQRLTSIVVLLTAIRDEARRKGADKVAERIQDLITNRHEDGAERFKVLPTQGESIEESDRAALSSLIDGTPTLSRSGILDAKRFFDKRVRAYTEGSLDQLFGALARKVTLVSIILGERDNPYRIFESLNGKGRPLTQGDLIRNFFFTGAELTQQIPATPQAEVISKPRPTTGKDGLFGKRDFKIDLRKKTATCPEGQTIPITPGEVARFDGTTCSRCPRRAQCTTASDGKGRTLSIAADERLQQTLAGLVATSMGPRATPRARRHRALDRTPYPDPGQAGSLPRDEEEPLRLSPHRSADEPGVRPPCSCARRVITLDSNRSAL